MLNELYLIQLLILLTLFLYTKLINVLTLWYAAGIYLILLGLLLLFSNADIFVGFLWVIDFGVGLIFFIFILHFSNFLYQKTSVQTFSKSVTSYLFYILCCGVLLFFLGSSQTLNFNSILRNKWFFFITWYNYYEMYISYNTSNLQLLRELYFYHASFEFFLINFMIFYGIISSVLLCFMLKKIFNVLTVAQLKNTKLLKKTESSYFIRTQNFLKQQNSSTGSRVWLKKKKSNRDL